MCWWWLYDINLCSFYMTLLVLYLDVNWFTCRVMPRHQMNICVREQTACYHSQHHPDTVTSESGVDSHNWVWYWERILRCMFGTPLDRPLQTTRFLFILIYRKHTCITIRSLPLSQVGHWFVFERHKPFVS